MSLRPALGVALTGVALAVIGAAFTAGVVTLDGPSTPVPPPITRPAETGSAPRSVALVAPGSHFRRAAHDRVPVATPGVGMGRVLLGQLTVAEPEQSPAYRRDEFGPAWADTNANGCDTRADVLAAWLINARTDGCQVTGGELPDPYTGGRVSDPSKLDVDHVVSLGDAWRSGAVRWSRERRTEFANDLRHLVPVSASVNRAKGDRSAENWLPPDAVYHCDYALITIATKHAYKLTVTSGERDALDRAITTC